MKFSNTFSLKLGHEIMLCVWLWNINQSILLKRRSSCVTSRGIPPTAYPVRGMCCLRGNVVPFVLVLAGGRGTTCPDSGQDTWKGPGTRGWIPPSPCLPERTWHQRLRYLWRGTPTPQKGPGTRGWRRNLGPETGVPPVDRQTDTCRNITYP